MSMESMAPPSPAPAPQTLKSDLEPDAIGLVGATFQAITHIAPAIAGFFFTAFIVSLAGIQAPLAYFIGVLVVLMLGSTLAQLAKHLPSAGSYYTYVARSVNPRAGFLTSWMYILYSPLVGGPLLGFFGFILAGELSEHYDIQADWLPWALIIIGAPLIAFLQWEGIKPSVRTVVVLGSIEMLIVFGLALSGFINPPAGTSATVDVFNPGLVTDWTTFALAFVFTVQGLTGWEASAPLAEETKDPRRNVPLSVMLSIIIIGTFLVFVFWGVVTGFGNDATAIVDSPVLPALALAQRVWGDLWWILLFAFANSVFAVCIACANVGTRMWYSMARSGSFPAALAKTHPEHKTPTNAILVQLALNLGAGLIGAWIWGFEVSFFLLVGLVLVLAVTVAYLMANLGVFLFYRREHRDEFNWILHFVFPLVSSAILLYGIYKSFPIADPYWQALIIDGVWLLIGILILVILAMRGNEEWMKKAGAAVGEAI